MRKVLTALLTLLSFISIQSIAQSKDQSKDNGIPHHRYLPSDSLISDFIYFCDQLETTHPDPYSGFGGRPFFRTQRDLTIGRIATDSLTLNDFCELLNEFCVPLKDMHTFVRYPQTKSSREKKYVQRISFDVVEDGLIVSGIAKPHADYLGTRLLSINGVPTDTLVTRMEAVKPSENRVGDMLNLSLWGNQDEILNRLGIDFDNQGVTYNLSTSKGDTITLTLPLVTNERLADVELSRLPAHLPLPKQNMGYTFLDELDNIMYFRLGSVMARENYKYCYQNGWDDSVENIKDYFKAAGKEMSENIENALNEIPSFSESFSKMLSTMKEKGTEYLIVDLRDNGGGWTPITLPSLMMMYGDEYYAKNFGTKSIRLLSDLYLKKINMSIDQLNQSWGIRSEVGDYLTMNNDWDADVAVKRNYWIKNAMTETPELLKSLDGTPLYRPKQIFVITDPGTFSAAFHYAFYLWKMGATLVGVAPSQAPNTFMEVTPFRLPYSGLGASVSNTLQLFVDADSPYAKTLIPDIKITSRDYYNHNLDIDTPILKAIELCGQHR